MTNCTRMSSPGPMSSHAITHMRLMKYEYSSGMLAIPEISCNDVDLSARRIAFWRAETSSHFRFSSIEKAVEGAWYLLKEEHRRIHPSDGGSPKQCSG